MKSLLIYLTTLTCTLNVVAQTRISISGILGNYSMSDVRKLQNDFIQQQQKGGFSVSASKDFPITPQVELGFDLKASRKGYWGGFFNYTGTKAVAGYGSPPWLIQSQQTITRYLFGLKRSERVSKNFYFVFKAGANFSKLDYQRIVDINSNNTSNQDYRCHSWGASFHPGFSWMSSPKPTGVGFEVSFGYEFNFQKNTAYDSNSNFYLIGSSGQATRIDWSGLRVGAALTYTGKKKGS